MLTPYKTIESQQHRIFNYRLNRARCISENSFGIFTSQWRIFRTAIHADVSVVKSITDSCVCLHNWLRNKNNKYIPNRLLLDHHEVNENLIPGKHFQYICNYLALNVYHVCNCLIIFRHFASARQ